MRADVLLEQFLRWREGKPRPEQMSGAEFQRFYDTGMMPERFWPEREVELRTEFADDKIDVGELEHSLEAMMGFPA